MAAYVLSFLKKGKRGYQSILWGCTGILTWTWDTTSSGRLNNFYKRGKKKTACIWIIYGRQTSNERVNSLGHATYKGQLRISKRMCMKTTWGLQTWLWCVFFLKGNSLLGQTWFPITLGICLCSLSNKSYSLGISDKLLSKY